MHLHNRLPIDRESLKIINAVRYRRTPKNYCKICMQPRVECEGHTLIWQGRKINEVNGGKSVNKKRGFQKDFVIPKDHIYYRDENNRLRWRHNERENNSQNT